MKVIFFGTPEYVLPIAKSLKKAYEIVAVVTQKPKPAGRKKAPLYSPMDKWAHQKKLTIHYSLDKLPEADLGVVASFGMILPKSTIDHFKHGILNIHPSLLPKYRGTSPVQAALVSGDTQTGVTIIKMDEKMDHGPIIAQYKEDIYDNDTTKSLRTRLFKSSVEVLVSTIPHFIKGNISLREQDHEAATFTTLLKKDHGFIPPKFLKRALEGKKINDKWKIEFMKDYFLIPSPQTLEKFVRAMDPWPVAWTRVNINGNQKRLKITKASGDRKSQKLILETVQLESKNPVSWEQFKAGYPKFSFS